MKIKGKCLLRRQELSKNVQSILNRPMKKPLIKFSPLVLPKSKVSTDEELPLLILESEKKLSALPKEGKVIQNFLKDDETSHQPNYLNRKYFFPENKNGEEEPDLTLKNRAEFYSLEQGISNISLDKKTPEKLRTGNSNTPAHSPILGFLTVCKI